MVVSSVGSGKRLNNIGQRQTYLNMGIQSYICTIIVVLTWLQMAQGQMFELSPMDMMQLTSAVQQIVHPNAQPSPAMIAIASRQGAPPTTLAQLLQYTPHFVNLAMRMGVRPPGTNGTVTPQAIRDYMVARGNEWMLQQGQLAGLTGGQMGLGSEMTGMGGLSGAMGRRQPMASLVGGQPFSSTGGMGMGLSPLSMMLLGGSGMESPALQMAMLGSSGAANPLSMMYFMENMV